ncbi:hypothetical protein KSP39_PZI002673 [Platanthera zijinensis]|uniref:INO80 complex subunit B-like conserved region domain-containing protein n=1 Tax=Platanthera zijinensis TaxID=2320716 RepID=A0AAP0C1D9_9ASPA
MALDIDQRSSLRIILMLILSHKKKDLVHLEILGKMVEQTLECRGITTKVYLVSLLERAGECRRGGFWMVNLKMERKMMSSGTLRDSKHRGILLIALQKRKKMGRGNGAKKLKLSMITKNSSSYVVDGDYDFSRMAKDSRKKSKSGRFSEDSDYVEEDEPVSDDNPEEKKKLKKLASDLSSDVRLEPLTTRQRALLPGKDGNGSSVIEFPDGLPPAPPRKQKQKLSEVEEQAKKAEAAQRRKMQVEKAARESEAAAIRKILGLDSDKKKAEKEKAQAEKVKAANSQTPEGSSIRWSMGPNGTVVTFPESVGLPSIFDSKPCSYPPPREKCAGPSCTNPYKYRDSKSNLPLCSLQCYKAIQGCGNHITSC